MLKLCKRGYTQLSDALRTTNALKKAQLDIKAAYENYDLFKGICEKRNVEFPLSSDFKSDYEAIGTLDHTSLDIRHQSNKLQTRLTDVRKKLKEHKDDSKLKNEQVIILSRLLSFKPTIKKNSEIKKQLQDKLFLQVSNLPNYIHPSVGSEQTLVEYLNPLPELVNEGAPKDYALTPNPERDHKDIMERYKLVEFQKATSNSGRGWYYLLNEAAMLEQALIQYSLKKARQAGFKMVLPPSIVKTEITNACGFKPRDQNNERQVYEISNMDLCLTGTAEIPLASLYSDTEFTSKQLPINHVGVSRSYRAEAGAAGRDTRGLYRVHEFTKVELFSWTRGEESESMRMFDKLVEFQKDFISSLGLTARVLVMPHNDLGNPAYKKIDIEVLMPGRGTWGEVSSTSNCLDFQSRRLTTKFRGTGADGKDRSMFVHTLNGTACAVPRVILAIIENFYDSERDVIVLPEVLRPYMDDMEVISRR